jgi:hypothetical protein
VAVGGLAVLSIAVPSVLSARTTNQSPPVASSPTPATPGPTAARPEVTGPPGVGTATGPDRPAVGVAYPYDLYVHCGIRYARFGGRWWHADPEQAAPREPEIGGVYIRGTMTLASADEARFEGLSQKITARFVPFAGDPPPCD